MKRTFIYLAVLTVMGMRAQRQPIVLFGTVDYSETRWRYWDVTA